MNTLQINKILRRNPKIRGLYLGCFPADRIPRVDYRYPHCMCVNTDESYSPGEHWTGIFVNSPISAEYYDSLGLWPPPGHIAAYLARFPHLRYQGQLMQSPGSSACGPHVIYFLYSRCAGSSFDQTVARIRQHRSRSDEFVRNFLRKKLLE